MRLTAHLGGFQGDDIEYRAISREEKIKCSLQISFVDLCGRKIRDIETIMKVTLAILSVTNGTELVNLRLIRGDGWCFDCRLGWRSLSRSNGSGHVVNERDYANRLIDK